MLQLAILGPLEVKLDESVLPITASKKRAMLSLLALRAGAPVSKWALIDAIWGEHPPTTALKALQTYVSALRHALPAASIATEGDAYRLEVEPDAVDVVVFERLVKEIRAPGTLGSSRAAQIERALQLWRGEPLTDLADHDLRWAEATRLGEMQRTLVEDLFDARLAHGEARELIADLEAAVRAEPLRERRWAQLMTALYHCGRQADSLNAYQRLRSTLLENLGVEPSPVLRRLEAAVLRQDESLEAPSDSHDLEIPTPVSPSLPTGIVTFMVTDILDAVSIWDLHSESMAIAIARHDAIISSAVAAHSGSLLSPHGDGESTFSVFRLGTDAAAAASTIQRSIRAESWPEGCDLRLRVALHTGEALESDGRYFGRTVNRVLRLRDVTEPGEILVSRATAELLVEYLPGEMSLRSAGSRRLRDIARPEAVYKLFIDPELSSGLQRMTTLGSLDATGLDPDISTSSRHGRSRVNTPLTRVAADPSFVGRLEERDDLEKWLEEAIGGTARFVLISGPAGIGKSALVARFVSDVPQGVRVLAGSCHEFGDHPFLPIATALEPLLDPGAPDLVKSPLSHPSRRNGMPDPFIDFGEPLDWAGPGVDREQLETYLWATRLLMHELEDRPVVLVIEDVHWADVATVGLLNHMLTVVAHQATLRQTPLMTVLTSRAREKTTAMRKALDRLGRDPNFRSLPITGLSGVEATELITRFRGARPSTSLLGRMMDATEGNPLLVRSALQRLSQSGALVVGEGNRLIANGPMNLRGGTDIDSEVIARLATLSPNCQTVLTSAAFLGVRGSLRELRAVVKQDEEQLDDALDEATEAELLDDDGVSYWFDHTELPRAITRKEGRRRSELIHRNIADGLEALYGGAAIAHALDIARHLRSSGSGVPPPRAHLYASVAGDQAFATGSWSEAATNLDAALAVEGAPSQQSLEILLRAGIAHFRNHDHQSAQARLSQAVQVGREFETTELWGLASMWLTKSRTISGTVGARDDSQLLDFVQLTGDDGSGLHARALAQLADSHFARMDIRSGMEFARRALEAAVDAKDDQVRCEVELSLGIQYLVRLDVGAARECFQRCKEAAERLGDPWTLSWGPIRLPLLQWTEGHLIESDRAAAQAADFAERHYDSAEASLGLACRAAVAVDRGRFDDAERHGAHAYQHFIRSDYFHTMLFLAPALIACRSFRGNLPAAEEAIQMAADVGLNVHGYRLAARAITQGGESIRAEFEADPFPGRREIPANLFDLASVAVEVEVASALGDGGIAERSVPMLTSADSRGIMFTIGWASSVPRLLGVSYYLVGQADKARHWLEKSIRLADRAEAHGEAARSRLDLVRVLLESDEPADSARITRELDSAISTFDRLGMTPFAAAAQELCH